MSPKQLTIKFLLFSTALLSPMMATPIKLTMTGAITASNMTAFSVGQQASVSLVYESSSSYQSLMQQQAFYVNAMTSISFTSGGYAGTDNTDPFGVINKYNDLPVWWQTDPWDGISFAAFSNAGNYTFTTGANTISLPSVFSNGVTQSFEGIRVNLEASYSTLWTDWSLPENLVISHFNANQSMLFGFSGGSFMTGISSLQVEVLSPEPVGGNNPVPDAGSTALLTLGGLAGLAGLRGRRRHSAA